MCAFLAAFAAYGATLDDDLRAAQALAWQKRFAESERLYRRILDRVPGSRAAALGLGQVLLWEQRYAAAARVYRGVLRTAPDDVDARKGLATAGYWSGDFRAARRDFRAVLQARPADAEARRSIDEIDAAMAPALTSDAERVIDDQPLQRTVESVSSTFFSDPLTKWTGTIGSYQWNARSRATAPFGSIAVDAAFPATHLRARAALRALRFPDGATRPLSAISLAREWSHSSLQIGIERREILYTAAALESHPAETTATIAWNRDTEASSSAAAVHAIRYFDRNRGQAAEAYHLQRVAQSGRASFSAGASASYRDTGESRFRLIGASAAPLAGGGFAYSYDARYDPYWTPRKLVEVRGILAAAVDAGRATIRLHGDGGWAHDRDLVFGPAEGTASLAPLFSPPIEAPRTFHPWRASTEVDVPLRGRFTVTAGAERQATVFYSATAFRLGLSGRL